MKLSSLAWEAAMRRAGLFAYALVLIVALPTAVRAGEPPETLALAEGSFRVTLEWVEDPAGEPWILDLGGEGGMFGATDGGEVARLEVTEEVAGGRVRAIYRVDERVAAFVVTDLVSGVTRRFPVSESGVLELDPAVFAAAAAAKVVPVLDTARAVKSFLDQKGGTITATDERGVKFTLTLPKGALTASQEITMTPLSSLGGFPFTPGFVAAVQIEPDGLRLWQLATLKIEAPAPVLRAEEVTFRFRRISKELFLARPVLGPGLSLKLARLTGAGVGRGTAAELAAQWQRIPTRPSDQLAQELAQAVAGQRRSGSVRAGARTAAEAGTCTKEDKVQESWFKRHQKTLASAKSCKNHRKTLDEFSDFMAEANENCPALKTARARVRLAQILGYKACYDEAFTRCTVGKKVEATFDILAAYRALVRLEAVKLAGVDTSKMRKCVRFDLDVSSEFTATGLVIYADKLLAKARVPIEMSGTSPDFYRGQSTIKLESAGWVGNANGVYGCEVLNQPVVPSVFLVHQLGLQASPLLDFDGDVDTLSALVPELYLDVSPGNPGYTKNFKKDDDDCREPPPSFPNLKKWRECWDTLHKNEAIDGLTTRLRPWARYTLGYVTKYGDSKEIGTTKINCKENTTLELLHKPQR